MGLHGLLRELLYLTYIQRTGMKQYTAALKNVGARGEGTFEIIFIKQ
jgi:hypothetical protein